MPIPLVLCKPWGILPESMPCHPKLLSFCKYLHERGEKVRFPSGATKVVERGDGLHGENRKERRAAGTDRTTSNPEVTMLSWHTP